MQTALLAYVYAGAVLAALATRLWLSARQIRHVAQHRDSVPAAFAAIIGADAHRRAADYTRAKARYALLTDALAAAMLIGWTLLGGLDALNVALRDAVLPAFGPMAYQLALFAAFALIGAAIELPFDIYRVFVLEERHGFNRMTPRLFVIDMFKGMLLGALFGLPLLALVLWIMGASGGWWWLWAWAAWTAFGLLMQLIYPTVIAPMFNKFQPLSDAALAERVTGLMQRCGFAAKGLFVMDGSKRSAHANAYFTGLGRSKRVVFFDTLLARLAPGEVEAVLAHELGHFHHKHVLKRMLMMFAASLAGLALLGWLAQQPAFYIGLGVQPNMAAPNDALALLLFMLALPPFAYFISPLAALYSRKDEFEADAYACAHARATDLSGALLKLYEDNASTLTPDPLYARFYYSHPPAPERLAAIAGAGA